MNSFSLIISSPEGDIFRDKVLSLSLRGAEGDLAIMAGHIPFVTTVKPCECKIVKEDGSTVAGHTMDGILTVSNEGVTLLSGSFSW